MKQAEDIEGSLTAAAGTELTELFNSAAEVCHRLTSVTSWTLLAPSYSFLTHSSGWGTMFMLLCSCISKQFLKNSVPHSSCCTLKTCTRLSTSTATVFTHFVLSDTAQAWQGCGYWSLMSLIPEISHMINNRVRFLDVPHPFFFFFF